MAKLEVISSAPAGNFGAVKEQLFVRDTKPTTGWSGLGTALIEAATGAHHRKEVGVVTIHAPTMDVTLTPNLQEAASFGPFRARRIRKELKAGGLDVVNYPSP